MTENEIRLRAALEDMLKLHDDIMNSKHIASLFFHDYALLNEAPMNARKVLEDTK